MTGFWKLVDDQLFTRESALQRDVTLRKRCLQKWTKAEGWECLCHEQHRVVMQLRLAIIATMPRIVDYKSRTSEHLLMHVDVPLYLPLVAFLYC